MDLDTDLRTLALLALRVTNTLRRAGFDAAACAGISRQWKRQRALRSAVCACMSARMEGMLEKE